MRRPKILLHAPINTVSGYGQHARLILHALLSYEDEFDVYVRPINWGQTSQIHHDSEERRMIETLAMKTEQYLLQKGVFDLSVQCTIPNEFQPMAPFNIGVTAGCETTKIPPGWIEKCHLMNRLIVVSHFNKEIFAMTSYQAQDKNTGQVLNNYRCSTPISVVPFPVVEYDPDSAMLQHKFDCDFNFLIMALWGPRKNLANAINWFVEQFKDRPDVGLVLKVGTANNSVVDREMTTKRLKNLLGPLNGYKCPIRLLHGYMTEHEIAALYHHEQIKALVNCSHGESFGLPEFQAAYSGLPIITTAWGGHNDFLFAPAKTKRSGTKMKAHFLKVNFDIRPIQQEAVWPGVLEQGSMWAFPQERSYKDRLLEMMKNYKMHAAKARKLQQYVQENFAEVKVLQMYRDIIHEVLSGTTPIVTDESETIGMLL